MTPKITKKSHFSVDESDPFVLTDHSFKVVIRGRPLVWKRVGWRYGGIFTPSKAKQIEFCKLVRFVFYINRRPIIDFGDADLEASI